MATYCIQADLLIGNIPTPAYISVESSIQAAADEINSVIGTRYIVPIELANVPTSVPARLLLKRANAHLASGRIIMSADAGGQNNSLHRYGLYLISTATKIIEAIASGATPLQGAPLLPGVDEGVHRMVLENLDPVSRVEAFYDGNFNNPDRTLIW